MVSVFLNTWYGPIMILRSRAEVFFASVGMGLLNSPNLYTLCRRATTCGKDGLGPEGGNSLLHITVIMTAMSSGKRISCEPVSMSPLIQEARWFPCGSQSPARKLILVSRQLRLGKCEQTLLLISSNLVGLIHGARKSGGGFQCQQFLH